MARRTTPVDREKLVEAISQIEGDNGIEGGITELCKQVAKRYNRNVCPDIPLTHSVVGLRIREWGLPIKTKGGRGRRKGTPMSEAHKAALKKGRARNTKSRAEKFKESPVAQESLAEMRRNTPPRFHNVLESVEQGSRTAAVKLHCLECSGWITSEVRKCECNHCSLFLFRPYQGKVEADEDPEQHEQDEHEDAA